MLDRNSDPLISRCLSAFRFHPRHIAHHSLLQLRIAQEILFLVEYSRHNCRWCFGTCHASFCPRQQYPSETSRFGGQFYLSFSQLCLGEIFLESLREPLRREDGVQCAGQCIPLPDHLRQALFHCLLRFLITIDTYTAVIIDRT